MQSSPRSTDFGLPPASMASMAPRSATSNNIQRLLTRFAPISLAQMDAVALQNRTDTKYLLSYSQLMRTLSSLADQYRVLEINSVRLNSYQTIYFDTPEFAFYLQHHAGKLNRYKVRSRRYLVTGQSFLEVKHKTNKDRTVKRRIATDHMATDCTPEVLEFIAAQTAQPLELEPKLGNEFSRITLVSSSYRERLTIDLDLRFYHEGRHMVLPGIAVAEVKQDGVDRSSGFIQQMQAAAIQPTGFSKYCIGVSLLYPQIKHNNFKPKLRIVEKLIGDPSYDD